MYGWHLSDPPFGVLPENGSPEPPPFSTFPPSGRADMLNGVAARVRWRAALAHESALITYRLLVLQKARIWIFAAAFCTLLGNETWRDGQRSCSSPRFRVLLDARDPRAQDRCHVKMKS
jgi:hypothetical protein